ncbi:MAG TPA: permease, partial [bacterium]|nr:permease [bacterium]
LFFMGIWWMGVGFGLVSAFFYSGSVINIFAIILIARIFGFEIGVARAVGAVVFSVLVGLGMHCIFRHEEQKKAAAQADIPVAAGRPLWQTATFFALMIAVLVFANWAKDETVAWWFVVWQWKWPITGLLAAGLGAVLTAWYGLKPLRVLLAGVMVAVLAFVFPDEPLVAFTAGSGLLALLAGTGSDETKHWLDSTWSFTKQILPLLLGGVVVAGLLLGRPGHEGLIPSAWVTAALGGNSLGANLFASVAGALMYFATLTEIPIMQGLLGSGMGQGPGLALLLAGPALSLPSMIVLSRVMGTKRMLVFVMLIVILSTVAGMLFGNYAG